MSDKMDAENAKAPTPLDIFEGIKGRLPETDRELEEWLASAEGKAAMMFECASTTRWGEGGHKHHAMMLRDCASPDRVD